jgi:hypothetical protein
MLLARSEAEETGDFGTQLDIGTLVLQYVSYDSYVELLNSTGDVGTVFDHNSDYCRS